MKLVNVLYDIFVTEETIPSTSFINKPNRKHTVNTRRLDYKVRLKSSLPLICNQETMR